MGSLYTALNSGVRSVTSVGFVCPSVKRSVGAIGAELSETMTSFGSCEVPEVSALATPTVLSE